MICLDENFCETPVMSDVQTELLFNIYRKQYTAKICEPKVPNHKVKRNLKIIYLQNPYCSKSAHIIVGVLLVITPLYLYFNPAENKKDQEDKERKKSNQWRKKLFPVSITI